MVRKRGVGECGKGLPKDHEYVHHHVEGMILAWSRGHTAGVQDGNEWISLQLLQPAENRIGPLPLVESGARQGVLNEVPQFRRCVFNANRA